MSNDEHSHLSFANTSDGSRTLFNAQVGEHYHSRHGALQESRHVFLTMGMMQFLSEHPGRDVKILEVGFGTGLNFLVSAGYAFQNDIRLSYTGIEAYPLPADLIRATGYDEFTDPLIWNSFLEKYPQALISEAVLLPGIQLGIRTSELLKFTSDEKYDVVYFDAFAAVHQPEMWSLESLEHVAENLDAGGIFVTYAITGELKRNMKSLGFAIEKVPGAAGKREMLRAVKL